MTIHFHKTTEVNSLNYVKNPLRSSATLNSESDDKICFFCWLLASLHPCNKNHNNRLTSYRQCFIELKHQGFVFSNWFKCNDIHKLEKLNNFSRKMFDLCFCQDVNKCKHKLINAMNKLIEISKTESEKIIDSLNYKNDYVLTEKLPSFYGKQDNEKIFL